eukprot:CAMPEP_0185735824 /NCGR_PEP_ID=MMETSP1171-20130828/26261_1 /TAXON_ID=374046 /ORGANISM="Helicotheca tamensis, Strain CCMP826" /LENGTH=262 /DNA_ID=CAMNT_0028406257 /DNA_START=285 /DNA_END=1073 /DNA_ORIENTATION=+
MKIQQGNVDRAPSTLDLFTTPKVCGLVVVENENPDAEAVRRSSNDTSPENQSISPKSMVVVYASTFDNVNSTWSYAEKLKSWGVKVDDAVISHCGTCGSCSNPHDIRIYDETKNTLTGDAKRCAFRALVGGRGLTGGCLRKNVGFTNDCNECWIDNIMCDVRKCLYVCMWNEIFGRQFEHNSGGKEVLNPCKTCDEKLCGPAFTNCAGANRRRSGIVSDIARDDKNELCMVADDGWWLREDLANEWRRGNWKMNENPELEAT